MNSHNLSFADRDASRKRMGLSQHVLTLIEKTGANFARGDSSETEEQCRQRCKSHVITVIWNEFQTNIFRETWIIYLYNTVLSTLNSKTEILKIPSEFEHWV